MKPYELFQTHPFPRRRSFLEKVFDRIELNRCFLREGRRPFFQTGSHDFMSPCDGVISNIQTVSIHRPIEGKGILKKNEAYRYEQLLSHTERRDRFEEGIAVNVYLSPLRLHYCLFPCDLFVTRIHYEPNRCVPLWFSTAAVTQNERIEIHGETPFGFPVLILLIGGFLVCGIECIAQAGKNYSRSEIMGGFKQGSMVMMLFPKDAVRLRAVTGDRLLLGEPFAAVHESFS